MQRRKVELGDPGSVTPDPANPTGAANNAANALPTNTGLSSILGPITGSTTAGWNSRSKRSLSLAAAAASKANFNLTLNVILLSIALLVAIVFLFPSPATVDPSSFDKLSPLEKNVNDFRSRRHSSRSKHHRSQDEIEHELRQRIEKQPPKTVVVDRRKSKEATEAMERQSSFWVDGEKKLKQKLKVLYERQQKGLDLGVPILTRYLGEDIPAWVGPGVDEKEWRAKVDAKYAEMQQEEIKWREEMKEDYRK